jgi:hypothetical protein
MHQQQQFPLSEFAAPANAPIQQETVLPVRGKINTKNIAETELY